LKGPSSDGLGALRKSSREWGCGIGSEEGNHPQISPIYADGKDLQTHSIIGLAMEVHRHLGPEFLEGVYQRALAIEFAQRSIPFVREAELPIFYKRERLDCSYRADFVCHGGVIVELKAIRAITGVEEAQLLNYLMATGLERGLILNFGRSSLQFKRLSFSNLRKSAKSADRF
jgi:GxxExxY protein